MKRQLAAAVRTCGVRVREHRGRFATDTLVSIARTFMRGYNNTVFDSAVNGEDRLLHALQKSWSPALVFDVGANEGQWARQVLEKWPNTTLHCFEPVTSTFDKLKMNLGQRTNVHLNKVGISSKGTELEVAFSPDHSSTATTVDQALLAHGTGVEWFGETEVCSFVDAGTYVRSSGVDRIDYLKIDVEGADYDVLRSFIDSRVQIDFVQFEFTLFSRLNRVLLADFLQLLEPEYSVFKIYPRHLERVKYDVEAEVNASGNYVAVSRLFPGSPLEALAVR